jgi:hypothetical protein
LRNTLAAIRDFHLLFLESSTTSPKLSDVRRVSPLATPLLRNNLPVASVGNRPVGRIMMDVAAAGMSHTEFGVTNDQ